MSQRIVDGEIQRIAPTNDGPFESPASVLRDYVAVGRKPTITLKLVPLDDVGSVRVLRPGEPPVAAPLPIKVAIRSNGMKHLMDGHHRVLRWRAEGYTHAMAWVLDYRRGG